MRLYTDARTFRSERQGHASRRLHLTCLGNDKDVEDMNQTSTDVPAKSTTQNNVTQSEADRFLRSRWRFRLTFNQEQIVLALAILLFAIFACTLRGFFTGENVLSMLRSVSILGVLSVGMAIAVIGRGIDLAIVTTMVMSVAWMLALGNQGVPLVLSL